MESKPNINSSDILSANPPNYSLQPKTNLLLPLALSILASAVVFGLGGYYSGRQSNQNDLPQQILTDAGCSTVTPLTNPSMNPKISTKSTYSYNSFSISYPKDWKFSSKKNDINFPLKDMLYHEEEAVLINNGGDIYLFIIINKAEQSSTETAISSNEQYEKFLYMRDYEEFISMHDKIMIQGSTFFLAKNHSSFSFIEKSHAGASVWTALSALHEAYPFYTNESENVIKGYSQTITKNGLNYKFVILGEKEGATPVETQSALKKIIESIQW